MASKAFANVDPARWSGLEPIALALYADGDPATPDLSLKGALGGSQGYAYRLTLEPKIGYAFRSQPLDDFAEQAILVDPVTGGVLWANAAAAASLSLPAQAPDAVVTRDARGDVLLVVNGVGGIDGQADAFLLETFVDVPVPAPPPPPEPPVAPAVSANAIHRFVKVTNGMYFYTASEAERASIAQSFQELRYEGPVFIGDDVAREGFVPVYRFANVANGGYFYTASEAERESLLQAKSWRAEGISFWVPGSSGSDTTPVYRLMNVETNGYLFTTNPAEKLFALLQGGWRDEGVAFQSLKSIDPAPVAAIAAAPDVSAPEAVEWSAVAASPVTDLFGLA